MALIDQFERFYRDFVDSKLPEIDAAITAFLAERRQDPDGMCAIRYDIVADHDGEISLSLRVTVRRYLPDTALRQLAQINTQLARLVPGLLIHDSLRTLKEVQSMPDRAEWEPLP